jgi:hypothetical protein
VLGIVFDPGTPDLFQAAGVEWLSFVTDNEGAIIASRLLFLLG